jgi:hypothetical protein
LLTENLLTGETLQQENSICGSIYFSLLFVFFVDVVIVIVSAFDLALSEELAGIWLFVVAAALEGALRRV